MPFLRALFELNLVLICSARSQLRPLKTDSILQIKSDGRLQSESARSEKRAKPCKMGRGALEGSCKFNGI